MSAHSFLFAINLHARRQDVGSSARCNRLTGLTGSNHLGDDAIEEKCFNSE